MIAARRIKELRTLTVAAVACGRRGIRRFAHEARGGGDH